MDRRSLVSLAFVTLLGMVLGFAEPTAAVAQCGPEDLVSADDSDFTCNGDPYRFVGVNIIHLPHFDTILGDGAHQEMTNQLLEAARMGAKVVRIFLPRPGKSTETVIEDLAQVLTVARVSTPDIKFIVVLTDFHLQSFGVIPGDVQGCAVESGSYPHTNDCFYEPESPPPGPGLVVLRQEWFTSGFRLHYKPFVETVVAAFAEPGRGIDSRDREYDFHPAQIFAWELGNELKILHKQADPALPVDEIDTMLDFAYEMGQTIRANQGSIRQMVTPGFLSTYHATNGKLHGGNAGQVLGELYHQRNSVPSPFDFAAVHGYNNEWAEPAPAGATSTSGAASASGAFFDIEWLRQQSNATPSVIEEIGFAGAARDRCGETFPVSGGTVTGYYPGGLWSGEWGTVRFVSSQNERATNTRLALNAFFDQLGADGVMQWSFNHSGVPSIGNDACRGMDDEELFQAGGSSGQGHEDWDALFDAYGCRSRILASSASAPDLYVQSLNAVQAPNGGQITFTIGVRNGGSVATTGALRVGLYIGPRGTDPFAQEPRLPAAYGYHFGILNPGDEATLTMGWTPSTPGEWTFAAVVNDDGTSAVETDRTCNNGFYQDCRIYQCGTAPQPGASAGSASGPRNVTEAALLSFCARAQPDLQPTNVTYDPSRLYAGSDVLFDSGVRNAGATSPGFNVRWRVDGLNVGAEGGHEGVPAGGTVLNGNSQFLWRAVAGSHTITFEVDSANTVGESNEGNNAKVLRVEVPLAAQPDLRPTAIRYDSLTLIEGREVLFDAGVQNAGIAGSGSFAVRWRVDGEDLGTPALHDPVGRTPRCWRGTARSIGPRRRATI